MDLAAKIEAILFFRAEPLSLLYLSKITGKSKDEVKEAVKILTARLAERGLILIEIGGDIVLGTNPEAADIISDIAKEELSRELSKAALETLSVILYQGPIAKADIDWIRGVNSQFILRSLLIRGLIEREESQTGRHENKYMATPLLLSHLGLSRQEELPDFISYREKVEKALGKEETSENPN
jgi:segregation and condensation protein B